jgi:two-component system, LytTR family, response regulator
MNILIIEDEPLVAKDLITLVRSIVQDVQISGPLQSVSSAILWLEEHRPPDLILSDIQLSDGISFEIFERSEFNRPVIFTSAYDEYAIRAFKINSIDYLLKPIDRNDLERALEKYRTLTDSSALTSEIHDLLRNWNKSKKEFKQRFLSQQRNGLVPVQADDISFFHKQELIFIYTIKNEKLICEHGTLDEVESLVDPARFFRVNRQHLVHIQAIAKIRSTHKGMSVMLTPPWNSELELSREKITAIKKWMS